MNVTEESKLLCLRDFEQDIADCFNRGEIRAPVHLSSGGPELLKIFKDIRPSDWVFSTHRSHLHALLKGVPPPRVREEILKGHSISLIFPEYRFFCSGIVAGVLPIAVGTALGGQRVWVFCGDMAAETGVFHECVKFALTHNLRIKFVVEDNGKSVCTPTDQVFKYRYDNEWPHQGTGSYVVF